MPNHVQYYSSITRIPLIELIQFRVNRIPLTECITEIDKEEQIKAGLTLTICIMHFV